MDKEWLITIDGPAGAGKTTVSRLLAAHLGYRYIDTGALYRAVALKVHQTAIDLTDESALAGVCARTELEFRVESGNCYLYMDNRKVSDQLRSPEITDLASKVSAKPVVRNYLLEVQRRLGAAKNAVFEGRDMGTVVFPEADIKFFLEASLDIRAHRRHLELTHDRGLSVDEVKQSIDQRDQRDQKRELAPLKAADDAIRINSNQLSVSEVVQAMLSYIDAAA